MRFKVEIELNLDFEKIFSEIPDGLFSNEDSGADEYYYTETISKCLRDTYTNALLKNMSDMVKDEEDGMYKYIKHHNECEIEAASQIANNAKISKID